MMRRYGKARPREGGDRRPHPLAALADRLVRQADHRKGDETRDKLDLDADGNRLDPLKGDRRNLCSH